MKTKSLQIDLIAPGTGTQVRARICEETVDQYAEAMQDAANVFPPVVVFHDGSQYILADGFHRVMAATRNRFKDILADVRNGTRADALRYALSANVSHGLRRTNADKRRSVELALAEWPKLSDRELAKVCAVGNQLVSQTRNELCESHSCEPQPTRIGADGKERKLPKSNREPRIEVLNETVAKLQDPDEDPPRVQCGAPEDSKARAHKITRKVIALADDLAGYLASLNPTAAEMEQAAAMLRDCASRLEANAKKLKA